MHAGNGAEKSFEIDNKKFFVDGYDAENHTTYEELGCYVHGCLKCFIPSSIMINKLSAGECNQQWIDRKEKLESIVDEQGRKMKVIGIWEHEIKEQLKKNPEMKEFFRDRPEKGRIDPRSAYSGGN